MDGIIRIDTQLRIQATNQVVRQVFSFDEANLQGMLITDFMPDITMDYPSNLLSAEEAQLNTSMQFQNSQLMVTTTPVKLDGKITGCIIAFHKMGSITP